MPLEVLIATPSGPFGELIRLSLEADPEFQCSLLDNSSELWSVLREKSTRAVIFDCAFIEPEPHQVIQQFKEDFPGIALLLVPPENRGDAISFQNPGADGLVSKPFDASSLPDYVKSTIEKKGNQAVPAPSNSVPPRSTSWWNAFQNGIRDTAASSGMIVQNGMVIACTPDTSTALQQQVTASIMRFWNPADSTDLMRYVKDLVTGQEWMMYASQAADNAVLVLLFLPQTPVTRVRAQTLQLAKEISPLLGKPSARQAQKEAGYLESAEPPRLHEILGENGESAPGTSGVIKNEFPVEWFKEADLPDFGAVKNPDSEAAVGLPEENPEFQMSEDISSPLPEQSAKPTPAGAEIDRPIEDIPSKPSFDVFNEISELQSQLEKVQDADRLLTDLNAPPGAEENPPTLNRDTLDLGNMQPVSLQTKPLENHAEDFLHATESVEEIPEEKPVEIKEVEISETLQVSENMPLEEVEAFSEEKAPLTENVTLGQPDQTGSQVEFRDAEIPDKLSAGFDVLPEYSNPEVGMGETPLTSVETSSIDSLEIQPEENPVLPSAVSDLQDMETVPESSSSQYDSVIQESALISPTDEAAGQQEMENTAALSDALETQEATQEATEDLYERMNQLESAAQIEETETITAALIPRSESIILQRQIAGALNQTMLRLCLAFNWKLDSLTIRPTYMQWTVTVPNTLSPDDMISIVRKETSQEIVNVLSADFSLTDKESFWADQSINVTGKDFVPSVHWQNFILRRKINEIA